jgi:hypothetical protein
MNVLTVFAHHPYSEVVDLPAIRFDLVLRERDNPNWMDEHAPDSGEHAPARTKAHTLR